MPGPGRAAIEAGGKAMHGDIDRIGGAGGGEAGDLGVVGAIKRIQATGAFGGIGGAIALDHSAIIKLHQQGRVILAPVWVDHQPRKGCQDCRRIQQVSQMACDLCRADIKGDMAVHVAIRQAQRSAVHARRHRVAGVITGD